MAPLSLENCASLTLGATLSRPPLLCPLPPLMVLTTLDCTPKPLGWKLLPLPPRPPLPPLLAAPADDDFLLLFSALRLMISSKLRFKASSAILSVQDRGWSCGERPFAMLC